MVPVIVTATAMDGETKVRDLLYVVQELDSTFVSRDALVKLGSVSSYFPQPPPLRTFGEVASIRRTATDTTVDMPCSQQGSMSGPTAACWCPVRQTAPFPCPAKEENKGKLEQFLKEFYKASYFNIIRPSLLCMDGLCGSTIKRTKCQ